MTMPRDLKLKRLGMIMEPRPGEPTEVEGVLNPAVARGLDGQLYLFPRLVGRGNYSRIGVARVQFDRSGDPVGVERLGIALEPEADYEHAKTGGGCEDPRISFLEPLQTFVMTYTAKSVRGPRIAIAISDDLLKWRRVGLVKFHAYRGLQADGIDDKDASIFPTLINGPMGLPAVAMLHRPLFPGTRPEEKAAEMRDRRRDLHRESIWISYGRVVEEGKQRKLDEFVSHHRLASPVAPWEELKIGGGAPPVLSRHGWLVVYHGVSELAEPTPSGRKLCYSAGIMVLSKERPRRLLFRTKEPVLMPDGEYEQHGTVDDVVFPTGIDRRDDLGQPDRFDVYYGMADDRIGVARLDMPRVLPESAPADG
jgi:predicted GH43/DUF377 family glycosyl hydrolase